MTFDNDRLNKQNLDNIKKEFQTLINLTDNDNAELKIFPLVSATSNRNEGYETAIHYRYHQN